MRKPFLMVAGVALILGSCAQKPEDAVKQIYDAANETKWDVIAQYITPDSIDPLSEAEIQQFQTYMQGTSLPIAPMYTQLSLDSLAYNAAGDTVTFTAHTAFKDGLSYTETGQLYKNADGKWKLNLADGSYSISDKKKFTKELLRNLSHGLDQVLAARNLPQYQLRVANSYFDGVMEKQDLKQYFTIVENVANSGNLEGKLRLASAYYNGYGVEKDYDKAFALNKECAEAGVARAMQRLGNDYCYGEGTVKDYDEAMKWYKKGADAGDLPSLNSIGHMYANGYGVPRDEKKALEYFMQSAEKGNCYAMYNIALYYREGWGGLEKDYAKAEEWWKKAMETAETESDDEMVTDCILRLGDLFYYSTKEYDKAFYYYKKAADRESGEGMYMVGECYEKGRGTDRDIRSAARWYQKSRDKNYRYAQQAFDRIRGWDYL